MSKFTGLTYSWIMIFPLCLSISKYLSKAKFQTIGRSSKHLLATYNSDYHTSMDKTHNILALDFDGVLCASSQESSYSAIIAAMNFWPTSFQSILNDDKLNIQKSIQYLRPDIDTGFENMLMARYLFENKNIDLKSLEKNWTPGFRDSLIQTYQANKVLYMIYEL